MSGTGKTESMEDAAPCRASAMAVIHRMFKAGFGEAPSLVAGVHDGDAGHADAVAGHLATLSAALHGHHEGEDQLLWDRLSERAPSCALHVGRMRVQHAAMLVHLGELDAALPAWRTTGQRSAAAPVAAALDGLNAALAAHLPDEEGTIVPVMERVMRPRELHGFSEHGRRSTPKGAMWEVLGAITSAQPDGGGAFLKEELPAPARVLWRTVGRRAYAKHRAALVRD